MARSHGIAILTCILGGTAAWIWFARGGDDPPPPTTVPAESVPRPAGDVVPESSARDALPAPAPPRQQPTDAARPPAPAPAAAIDAAPALLLAVLDATTAEPIAAFRWRWQSGAAVLTGDGIAGEARLELPPGRGGDLLVEAKGYQALLHRGVALTRHGDAGQRLDLALQAAAVATGIALSLRTADGEPVQRVRVDAFRLVEPGDEQRSWQLGKPLWIRQTTTQHGTCTLPDLPPGRYGIRVLAVDDQSKLLPLSPYRQVYELTGSNGFREDVVLEPGSLPAFTFVDGNGAPFDPERQGVVGLMLRPPGGPDVSRHWLVASDQGQVQSLDHLPAAGTTTPAEPLLPGNYELEVRVAGDVRVRRMVALQPGAMAPETIVVR